MGRPFFSARYLVVFSSIVAFGIASVSGQQPAPPKPAAPAAGPQQGIYLVFPFENAGVGPRLEWLGEGLEELTIQRLSAAGEQVYSHAGRLVELERYGLPHTSKFRRATMLRAKPTSSTATWRYSRRWKYWIDLQRCVVSCRLTAVGAKCRWTVSA